VPHTLYFLIGVLSLLGGIAHVPHRVKCCCETLPFRGPLTTTIHHCTGGHLTSICIPGIISASCQGESWRYHWLECRRTATSCGALPKTVRHTSANAFLIQDIHNLWDAKYDAGILGSYRFGRCKTSITELKFPELKIMSGWLITGVTFRSFILYLIYINTLTRCDECIKSFNSETLPSMKYDHRRLFTIQRFGVSTIL